MLVASCNGYAVQAVPRYVLSQAWRDQCKIDPVGSYISGSYAPCVGSPFTRSNVNKPAHNCPLLQATLARRLDVFDELIGLGASPALCDGAPERFYSYMLDGCSWERKEDEAWLNRFQELNIRSPSADGILLLAIKGNCVRSVKWSLAHGAHADAKNPDGHEVLYGVVSQFMIPVHFQIVNLLVAAGADPKKIGSNGDSPFEKGRRLHGNSIAWKELEKAFSFPSQ